MESMTPNDFVEVPPSPFVMESMRAHGYTLATAVADLIDNSIAAHAKVVTLTFHWAGSNTWISILDDGDGMPEARLDEAMRLGSSNPLDKREAGDLGRFGLGLKTASLSQCRSLTVATRQSGAAFAVRRWDLDYLAQPDITGWRLLTTPRDGSVDRLASLKVQEKGTVVLLEVLDRIVGEADITDVGIRNHFQRLVQEVERHLEMVFHRLLEKRRLRILLNGSELAPWDPFLRDHPATQRTPVDSIPIPGFDEPINLKGYVLPHKDKLGAEVHAHASGPAGWNAQQGFYLYRNERLIVAGSWLGLGPGRGWTKEEHYKLARLRLDVPSSMDQLWQLDVKKSSAHPPPMVAERLAGLAETVRKTAREVFSHRGKYGPRRRTEEMQRPWKSVSQHGFTTYRIDRKHPVLSALISDVSKESRAQLEAALRIIEETVPVHQIWLDAADRADDVGRPFAGSGSGPLRKIIECAYAALRRNRNLDHREAVALLLVTEEFAGDEAHAIIATLGTTA
jgi:hypothetical protein